LVFGLLILGHGTLGLGLEHLSLHSPPYSSDLASVGFCLFPKLEEFIKGWKFVDDEDVIHTANGWLEDQD